MFATHSLGCLPGIDPLIVRIRIGTTLHIFEVAELGQHSISLRWLVRLLPTTSYNVVFAKGFFNETKPPLSKKIEKLSVMRLDVSA
jgi:hypothetical protein